MQVCPYLEYSFHILGRKWNGLILHYLSLFPKGEAHFSEIQRDLKDITPRALSLKLTELQEHGLLEKVVTNGTPVVIAYRLTEKGRALTEALGPVQQWAQQYQSK
ncbi:helix-turn-helix domain-containing protein [Gorillibacterium sp. CAU 1737]|uniref:winged helix-turn-helix transcriptional regulator n=1 Tax=Gorillibacterium sp. CAU 1737 TaxID=3140362 RepID=UPI00326045FE